MLRRWRFLFAAFLVAFGAGAAITQNGEVLEDINSADTAAWSGDITVPLGTNGLTVSLHSSANEEETSVVYNGTETCYNKLEDTLTSSTDAGLSVWVCPEPTIGTNDLTVTISTGSYGNFIGTMVYAWAGLDTTGGTQEEKATSMATGGAIVQDGTGVEYMMTGHSRCAIASSEGSSGDVNVLFGTAWGNDMNPATNDAGFTELADLNDGGGNNDGMYYVAYGAAPAQPNLDFAAIDESICGQLLLHAAAGDFVRPLSGNLAGNNVGNVQ